MKSAILVKQSNIINYFRSIKSKFTTCTTSQRNIWGSFAMDIQFTEAILIQSQEKATCILFM